MLKASQWNRHNHPDYRDTWVYMYMLVVMVETNFLVGVNENTKVTSFD